MSRLAAVRAALAGLTTRGRCLLAVGVTLLVAAVAGGLPDLQRAGLFLLALPLVAVAVVSRTRYRLACHRTLEPVRVAAGRPATVRLRLDNVARLPTGTLLLEDALPPGLGRRPRFVLDRVEPGGTREVQYTARADGRGRYRVGPLSVRLRDPFGLVELTRSFQQSADLIVTPTVSALPPVRLGGDGGGVGESAPRAASASGADDASTRLYRQGDDVRKVHWRSTARTGELMVRREEQSLHAQATVLLDGRRSAHRGAGLASSHEYAVCAAASVAVALVRGGFAVTLVDQAGRPLTPGPGGAGEAVLLETLAVVRTSPDTALGGAATALRSRADGLLVAVVGALGPADAARLARLRPGFATCVAITLDTATWAPDGRSWGTAPAGEASPAPLLEAAGWRVVPVRHGTTLASVWPLAGLRPRRPAPAR